MFFLDEISLTGASDDPDCNISAMIYLMAWRKALQETLVT